MIVIKNLVKSFDEKDVISGINLSITDGERIAIIGTSGCGKSTLLRLLMGLHAPDSGEILIDGRDISHSNRNEQNKIRMEMGIVFQSAALFDSMSVADNVAFSLIENHKLSRKKAMTIVREKLEMVGLSDVENLLPSQLSGGMRKRVGFARAIATNPKILLFDEPTTGLDPISSTQIEDLIVHLSDSLNCTTIVVTHQISTILRTADKIYTMNNGILYDPETPNTIMNSQNPYIRTFIRGNL